MGNINVLSVVTPEPKAAKGSQTPVEGSNGGQSAAASFAAIFGNWVQGPGGQNGSENEQGQDKGAAADPKPTRPGLIKAEDSGILMAAVGMLQPGPALFTTVPASKEANSGETTGQAGFLQEAMADLAKGDFKGAWMALSSEGASLDVSELDKYKVQITYLLDQLSGKIETGAADVTELIRQLKGQDGMAGFLSLLAAKAGAGEAAQGNGNPAGAGTPASGNTAAANGTNANGTAVNVTTASGNTTANGAAANGTGTASGGAASDTAVPAGNGGAANAAAPGNTNASAPVDTAAKADATAGSGNNDATAVKTAAQTGQGSAKQGAEIPTQTNQVPANQAVADQTPAAKATAEKQTSGPVSGEVAENGAKELKTSSGPTASTSSPSSASGEKSAETPRIFSSMSQGEGQKKGSGRESDANSTFRGEISYGLFGDKVSAAVQRSGENEGLRSNQAIPVWEQVQNALKEKLAERSELKNLTLQLKPAMLGTIQIALRWEAGTVHLHCLASQPATEQALQDKMPELRQSLENMGVSCGTMETGLSNGQQQGNHQQEYSREQLGWNSGSNPADAPASLNGADGDAAGDGGEDLSDGIYQVNVKA